MAMKSRSMSISEFQRQQIQQQTFKRNKKYLNFQPVQTDEKQLQIKRRNPFLSQISPKSSILNKKISLIFKNSVQVLSEKVGQQMKKFKNRVSPSSNFCQSTRGHLTSRTSFQNPQETSIECQQISQMKFSSTHSSFKQSELKKYKIKGIPIEKQITRDHLHRYNVQKNNVMDERNYSNFFITKHDLSKTQDFKKLSPRNINFVNHHINDLSYNTQRSYQKIMFSDQPMKTTFRYNVQNNKEERKFYVPLRSENVAKTGLDPEKIRKSLTQTSNFKPNKIDAFFKATGRNLPHQLDQRNLSPNRNFYKDKDGKLIRQKIDYSAKKMSDDMIRKQKQSRRDRNNPQFTRDQICDQIYFRQIIKRQKKLNQYKKHAI